MEEPIIIERTYDAPISKVWRAITNNDDMKQWYFQLAAFKPEVGFEFQFEGGDGNKTFMHLCKVTEVIPGKKITYSWRYQGQPGISFVSFELFEEGKKTRLRLTHTGLDSFPQDAPEFARKNFVAGWTDIIGKNLKQFVEVS
jgi:uncharacterized protein YndB with AHSA1/START domain